MKEICNNSLSTKSEYRCRIHWIALPVLIVFSWIFPKKKKTTIVRQNFKADALKQDVDFGNLIKSSFHSAALYDELKVKCHPDRFPADKEKNQIADRLFQEITENRTNIKRLEELKEQAKNLLGI